MAWPGPLTQLVQATPLWPRTPTASDVFPQFTKCVKGLSNLRSKFTRYETVLGSTSMSCKLRRQTGRTPMNARTCCGRIFPPNSMCPVVVFCSLAPKNAKRRAALKFEHFFFYKPHQLNSAFRMVHVQRLPCSDQSGLHKLSTSTGTNLRLISPTKVLPHIFLSGVHKEGFTGRKRTNVFFDRVGRIAEDFILKIEDKWCEVRLLVHTEPCVQFRWQRALPEFVSQVCGDTTVWHSAPHVGAQV